MRMWIITAIVVVLLVILAALAGLWVPTLLVGVVDNNLLIQPLTAAIQLGLLFLAALAGAIGLRRALRQQGDAAGQTARSAGKPASSAVEDPELSPSWNEDEGFEETVTLYTAGGVRIVADSSCLGMDGEADWIVAEEEVETIQIPLEQAAASNGEDSEGTVPAEAPRRKRSWRDRFRSRPEATDWRAGQPADAAGLPASESTDFPESLPVLAYEGGESGSIPTPQPTPVITTPFNLPADLTDFTGRRDEMEAVRRRLKYRTSDSGAAHSRAVAISGIAGMGGIGKTALALHVAHELAAEGVFPDGQLYIDLKGTESNPLEPAAALGTLLTALLGPDPGRPDDAAALAKLWRAALEDRQLLLVLDNAANAAQVQPLMPGASGSAPSGTSREATCAVIITSRQRFRLPGAGLLDLNRLKADESRTLLQRLAPRLDPSGADRIAELCGGLPLALRIAGNYLALNAATSVDEYAARLADERERLSQLRDPNNPDLDVAATLSLSVAQLDAGTRWAWSLLSLFTAPFDEAAASALWGDGVGRNAWDALGMDATRDRLAALRNRSLVTYDTGTGRHNLHDLLHLAASQDLNPADAEAARARLLHHYLGVVKDVDERQRYLSLDADWPHLQATLKYARQELEPFSELVLALNNYWSARGMARERADWNRRAARACSTARRHHEQGIHLGNLGSAYAERGDARRAIEYYGQALTLSRGNGSSPSAESSPAEARIIEASLLGNLGKAYAALGEARRAIHYHEQALEIARSTGDQWGEGIHLGNLGQAYAALGEPRRAIDYHLQALSLAQEIDDQRMEGNLLGNLGQAYIEVGDIWHAIDCQKQALIIHRQVGDRRGEAVALDSLGRAYADLGEYQRAVDHYEQALEIARAIGDRRAEAADLANLGLAYAAQGEAEQAIDVYVRALEIAQQIGDRRTEGICMGNMGRAFMEMGDASRAMESYHHALRIAQQIGDRRSEALWLGALGEAHGLLGDLAEATTYHEQALSIYQEVGDRRSEGVHLASLGLLARDQGDPQRAQQVWGDALQAFETLKDPNASQVWHWLADLDSTGAPVAEEELRQPEPA